jgi:hypothetical protein
MAQRYVVRRDTPAWKMQVWISFALSALMVVAGVLALPFEVGGTERAFLALGAVFCLFTCFALAKTLRDNQNEAVDTKGWIFTVWIGFGFAFTLTGWGIYKMEFNDPWHKYFMVAAGLYLVSSAFTLAKMIRDNQEADLLESNPTSPAQAPE